MVQWSRAKSQVHGGLGWEVSSKLLGTSLLLPSRFLHLDEAKVRKKDLDSHRYDWVQHQFPSFLRGWCEVRPRTWCDDPRTFLRRLPIWHGLYATAGELEGCALWPVSVYWDPTSDHWRLWSQGLSLPSLQDDWQIWTALDHWWVHQLYYVLWLPDWDRPSTLD